MHVLNIAGMCFSDSLLPFREEYGAIIAIVCRILVAVLIFISSAHFLWRFTSSRFSDDFCFNIGFLGDLKAAHTVHDRGSIDKDRWTPPFAVSSCWAFHGDLSLSTTVAVVRFDQTNFLQKTSLIASRHRRSQLDCP